MTRTPPQQSERSWAQVASGATGFKSPESKDPSTQRLALMEKAVATLLTLLIDTGQELPPSLTGILDALEVSDKQRMRKVQTPPSEPSIWSNDSAHEQHAEDEQAQPDTSMQRDEEEEDDLESHPEIEEPQAKRPALRKDVSPVLQWWALECGPFAHVMWTRVKADGNCMWRAAAWAARQEWRDLKRNCLANLGHLKQPWLTLFGSGEADWNQKTQGLEHDQVWGNEVCLSLLAQHLQRPIIVVGVGQVFMTAFGPRIPGVAQAVVLKLEKEHYWAMSQSLTMSMLRAAHGANPLDMSAFHLSGGGRRRAPANCANTITTWNPGALDEHHLAEAIAQDSSIIAVQETGLTSRGQKRIGEKARLLGWTLLCGAPAPLLKSQRGAWRADKRKVPGVAILAKDNLHIGVVQPKTPSGRWLGARGRLLLSILGLAREQAVVGVVYMPTGSSTGASQDRTECHEALCNELASWRQVPFLIAGDWNSDLAGNPTAAILSSEGWHVPPLFRDCSPATHTFRSPSCSDMHTGTILDYWLVSSHFHNLQAQQVGTCPDMGHAPVTLRIPQLLTQNTLYMVPPAATYKQDAKGYMLHSPIDWEATRQQIQQHIADERPAQAWSLWGLCFHQVVRLFPENPSGRRGRDLLA